MTKRERNNTEDAAGMIRALCALFFAILLTDYSIGSFSWHWPILMTAVIGIFFAGNALVTLRQKRMTE
jgi:hypothetical protein